MTFSNTEQRIHYDLLYQNKERVEVIESEYKEIMRMKSEGLTLAEIGKELGLSKATLYRKIARYKKQKALEDSNQK